MAIENLFAPQLLTDRDLSETAESMFPSMLGHTQTGGLINPLSNIAGISSLPFYNSNAAPSDSGLTVFGSGGKKRARDQFSLLGDDELSALFQQQMLDLDILLARRREEIRMELAERRKRFFSQQLAAAVENGFRKQLKAKDEEMERLKKLNWALEDRLRSACAENQIWRELVRTNEVTTNLLRTNLEQILEQQPWDQAAAVIDDDDDAESVFSSSNDVGAPAMERTGACRSCGVKEATVLLLPCCHLCLCAACSADSCSCPVCNCCMKGTVNVNL